MSEPVMTAAAQDLRDLRGQMEFFLERNGNTLTTAEYSEDGETCTYQIVSPQGFTMDSTFVITGRPE